MAKKIDISKVKEALRHKANPYQLELWLKSIVDVDSLQEESSFYGYIPIRLIALIEDNLRDEYTLIIDDKRFRKNLTEVVGKSNPLNVEVLSSLQDDEITIGEYFSYSLSCNGIEDIINNLSKLLDCSFRDELIKELGNTTNCVFEIVGKVFMERHVLCHESSIEPDYNKSIIISYIQAVSRFLEAIRNIVQNKLYPNSPQITSDMINEKMAEFEVVDKELEETIQTIKNNDQNGIIEETGSMNFVEDWKNYRDKRAEIDSKAFEESIMPIVYYESKTTTTKWLIKELRSTYKFVLRSENK